MVDRRCWADGQLRGRSCVTSGRFPATKSRIFPLRLVLLSSSAVRRRKDPDEQLAFHYEIQHWGRAGPSATGADLSLFLSRTGSSCWGGNVTSQLRGAAAAAEAAVFFRWRCNAGREAGRVNQTWKRELQCWKLSSVGLIPAAARRIHHLFLCCWRSTEWLRVQRFTNSERERGNQKSASSARSCYCVLCSEYFHQVHDGRRVTCRNTYALSSWRDGLVCPASACYPEGSPVWCSRRGRKPAAMLNRHAQASRGRWRHTVLG